MQRNVFGGADQAIRQAVKAATRGREIQLAGPVDSGSSGEIGTVAPDGTIYLYGLLDSTAFEGFRVA